MGIIRAFAVRKQTARSCVSIRRVMKRSGIEPMLKNKTMNIISRRLSRRKAEFDSDVTFRSGDVLPVVLVATKSDATPSLDKNALDLFCINNGFVAWFPTSAKKSMDPPSAQKHNQPEHMHRRRR